MSDLPDFLSKLPRPPGGFERFEFDFGQVIAKRSIPFLSNRENGLWPAVINRIMDDPGPRRMVSPVPSTDAHLYKVWRAFLEISHSFEAIQDAPKYLQRSPTRRMEIPLSRYMAWHVHGYLNEIYILQLRLNSFWSLLHKTYRSSLYAQSKNTKGEVDRVLKAFKSVVDARGAHVHEARIEDPEIDRLALIDSMGSFPWPDEMQPYFSQVRRQIKKSWISRMATNEAQIKLALDRYCELVHPILFQSNGDWIDP